MVKSFKGVLKLFCFTSELIILNSELPRTYLPCKELQGAKKTTKKKYKNLINRLSLAKHDRNMMNKILTKKAHNNCPPPMMFIQL